MYKEFPQPQFEKPKNKLDMLLAKYSIVLMEDLKENYLIDPPIIDESCSLIIDAFASEVGGTCLVSDIEKQKEHVVIKEKEWFEWDEWEKNPGIREFYEKQHHINTKEEAFKFWQMNRETSLNKQFEKFATILLNKAFGDRFIIVRSTKYDDYENGVDNLIVDKKTGNIVCAFDELSYTKPKGERDPREKEDRLEKKMQKVIKQAKKGGCSIEHGLSIKRDEIQRGPLQNIPLFYFSVNSEEIKESIKKLDPLSDTLSISELEILDELLCGLQIQVDRLKNEKIPQAVGDRLQKFQDSFLFMKLRVEELGLKQDKIFLHKLNN